MMGVWIKYFRPNQMEVQNKGDYLQFFLKKKDI